MGCCERMRLQLSPQLQGSAVSVETPLLLSLGPIKLLGWHVS